MRFNHILVALLLLGNSHLALAECANIFKNHEREFAESVLDALKFTGRIDDSNAVFHYLLLDPGPTHAEKVYLWKYAVSRLDHAAIFANDELPLRGKYEGTAFIGGKNLPKMRTILVILKDGRSFGFRNSEKILGITNAHGGGLTGRLRQTTLDLNQEAVQVDLMREIEKLLDREIRRRKR